MEEVKEKKYLIKVYDDKNYLSGVWNKTITYTKSKDKAIECESIEKANNFKTLCEERKVKKVKIVCLETIYKEFEI